MRIATTPMLAVALLLCGTAFADLTLVRDGRPLATVVISAQATASEQFAAAELARCVEQISGAKLAVVGAAEATTGPRVLVGTLERLGEFKVSTPKPSLHIEGFVIRTIGDDLLLAGRSELGTVFAVYHFLERHLGCRWPIPGPLGEILPKKPSITLGSLDVVENPSFDIRTFQFGDRAEPAEWGLKNRLNGFYSREFAEARGNPLYRQPGVSAHSFFKMIPAEEHFQAHPEYFPLLGARRTPYSIRTGQLCTTSLETMPLAVHVVLGYLAEQPKARTYVVSPNDGYGWCECGRCKAFDLVYAEGRKTQGGYPVTTDRIVRFVNEVTATVNRAYPDLLTQTLAYVNYVEPPSTFRPVKNSIIWHCHYTPACYAHAIENPGCPENAKFKAHLERWLKVAPESLGIYAYTDKSMWFYLPRPVAQPMAADIKLFHRLGIKYYYAQSAGAVWAQNLPLYYLTAKLLWNVNEDVDAVVGDFYRCLFDDAARPMREFYAAFEKAAAKTGVHFNHSARTEAPQFLTPEVMADARAKLDEAARLAKSEPVAQRIAAVREHFERSYGLWDMIYNYYVYEETGKREYLQKAAALLPKQLKARGVDTWFAGQFRGIEQEAGALGGVKWSGFGKEMTLGGRQCWNSDETGVGDNAAGWASFEFFLDDVTKPIRIRMLVWGKSEFSSLVICSEGRGKGAAAGGKWTPLKPDKPLSGQEQWDEMVFVVAPDKFEKGRQRQIVGFGGGDSQVWVAEASVGTAN